MNARWHDTQSIGMSGYVQSRLVTTKFPTLVLAEVEFHAPIYYVNITRHVAGYVDNQLNGAPHCRTLDEAKAVAVALARLS